MHRTALADERASRAGEDTLDLQEDPPEAIGEFGIVRVVLRVALERNGIGDLDGTGQMVTGNAMSFSRA